VLIRLLRRVNHLPESLFLKGVELVRPDPVSGGGFADVFLGRHKDGLVAMKRLRLFQAKTDTESARIRFHKEALLWQCVQHPNVLPLLGMDNEVFSAQYICMISPWMKNRDISSYMKEVILFSKDCNRLLSEVAQGLAFLHEQNIVHGDLRGGNIMVSDTGHALLSDFGLADVTETTLVASTTTQRNGSTRWMAPELHDPARYGLSFRRTKSTDIYAYACVSVEIYSGRMPFFGYSDIEAILKTLDGIRPERPTFQDGGREMSEEHWTLVNLCWQNDSSRRPSASQI
ncbi:kinase-like protein, partial [Heliocybe sulcata]